ncbi:MAG: hypothetical protein RR575_07430 [Acinetobacter sp.]
MQTPKYYIPEYYIKNTLLSFLGLVVFVGVFKLIVNYMPPTYETIGVISAIIIMIIGLVIIGYFNALSASKSQDQKASPLYLHSLFFFCY